MAGVTDGGVQTLAIAGGSEREQFGVSRRLEIVQGRRDRLGGDAPRMSDTLASSAGSSSHGVTALSTDGAWTAQLPV
jgi:hypothetical protein